MNELDYQKQLAESLNIEFEMHHIQAEAFYGNQFKNSNGKKWNKKPDLIIFHKLKIIHPLMKVEILKSPIGIEFKNGTKFNQITTGVLDQIKGAYSQETYYLNKIENDLFELGSLAFTTTTGCSEGKIYTINYPEAANFFIERFCWRANVAILMKEKEFFWSYDNYRFNLNGKPIGKYIEKRVFEKYD